MTSRTLVPAALVLVSWTVPAVADPVTAVYHIQVTERMTPQSNPGWIPFEQEFMLSLRPTASV